MAELTSTEQLQPCLLDRLTDDKPGDKTEGRAQKVVNISRYREAVLRDLRWLFTSSNHSDDEGFEEFPEVKKSVLNFGIRSLCGVMSASVDSIDFRNSMAEAIATFEPRIDRDSLSVDVVHDVWRQATNELSFELHGNLWAFRVLEELFIKTSVDLETGDLTDIARVTR